jgi:type I restriction enzyme, S subunit
MTDSNGSVLADVAEFIRGITFTPEDVTRPFENGTTVCMRTKNVQADLDLSDLIAIPNSFVRRNEQVLCEGDLLVSSANSWNLVGKCCWVPKLDYRATAGGFISILRANRKVVDPRYLYYWFSAPQTQHEVRLCGRQTTNISNLNYERCLGLPIPVPPLEEQKRIAAILDKADAIRRRRHEAPILSRTAVRDFFLHLFGDPISNPNAWDTFELSEVTTIVTGNTPSRKEPANYGDGIEWIKSDNINTPDHFITEATERLSAEGEKKCRTVPAGATLVTCIAGTPDCIGNAALTDRRVAFNQQINAVVPGARLVDRFLYSMIFVLKPAIQLLSSKSMKGMVSKGRFETLRVIVPPRKLQDRFVAQFDILARLAQKMDTASQQSDVLFHSLVQRAFRGEL